MESRLVDDFIRRRRLISASNTKLEREANQPSESERDDAEVVPAVRPEGGFDREW